MDIRHVGRKNILKVALRAEKDQCPNCLQRSSRKQLTFLTHKLPTTLETCKALQTPFLPRPLRPGPLPAPAPPSLTHPRRSGTRGGSPAPSSAFCPRAGALELAHGRTGHAQRRPRRQPRFAGARTGRRAGGLAAAAGAPAPGVGVAGSFPPNPSLLARGSRSRRGRRERRPASTRAGRARPEPRAPYGAVPGEEPRGLGRVRRTGTAWAQTALQENSLRALVTWLTMSAKSAISKEIFAPLDERMLGAVQVKRRTKKKIPFLATGGQGEYLTYICLSVTNKKPTQASITKVKQFEGSTSFVRRSQWMLEQLRQVNGIDPNRDSAEFDLLFENAFDQWVASTASEKCTFFQILHHTCQRYLTDRKPEFINCQSKIMGGNSILHSAADSVTSAVQKASQALNERGERLGRAEEKTEDLKNSAQQFAETAHKLAMKHKC
ncbi:hypothetical protein AB1E19_015641 [Capra hircus]